jgi:hypothetical protein
MRTTGFRYSRPANDAAPRPRVPTQLETELRSLVLRAARAYPDVVDAYLTKVETIERCSDKTFRELITYAPVLAQTHPAQLARVAQRWLIEELPNDASARWIREAREQRLRRNEVEAIPPENRSRLDELMLSSPSIMHHSFSHHDWDRLSIGGDHQGFFPASPLREPFHSLLMHDPATALSLIRNVTNHATTAWRQLHRHLHNSATPLPLVAGVSVGTAGVLGGRPALLLVPRPWRAAGGGVRAHGAGALGHRAARCEDAHWTKCCKSCWTGIRASASWGSRCTLPCELSKFRQRPWRCCAASRLWRLDLQRQVQEHQLQSAGLMGFDNASVDAVHRQAVADSSQMTSRRLELRDLVPLFVLGGDTALRDACRAALDDFPNKLEFAYQEEAQNPEHVAELRRTAELWSELGHAENYTTSSDPRPQ